MMLPKLLLLIYTLISLHIHADQYLYPVGTAQMRGEAVIYVLYQKDTQHIELWQWNPCTHKATKALLSSCTPAGLKVLPSGAGFSFIDEGRIRVKHLDKRQPKAIDINEPPLYTINIINWIDDDLFYFSAQEHERFGIYQTDSNGQTFCIVQDASLDAMYPQKINSHLFYIERSAGQGSKRYRIMRTLYPEIPKSPPFSFNDENNFEQYVLGIMHEHNVYRHKVCTADLILDFENHPIAFLHMITENEGFAVEFPEQIGKRDKIIPFIYHHIYRNETGWHRRELFNFSIPSNFLLSDSTSKLYESILPLLPQHIDKKIIITDSNGHFNGLSMKSYDIESGLCVDLIKNVESGANFFAPILFEGKILYGGTILDTFQAPSMNMQEDGITLELPVVEIG